MRDIIWKRLSGFEKFIFVLGWFNAGNAIFWVVMLLVYVTRDESNKRYSDFFSPHTFKVPYIFGWIMFFTLLLIALFVTLALLISSVTTVTRAL